MSERSNGTSGESFVAIARRVFSVVTRVRGDGRISVSHDSAGASGTI